MKLKVAITHDIDRMFKSYHYLTKIITFLLERDYEMVYKQFLTLFFKRNSYDNFEEIIRIEKENNIKATYFFLNESIPFRLFSIRNWYLSLGRYNIENKRTVEVIKLLKSEGHEIGVHGSYLSYKNEILLSKEKKALEKICEESIIGIRQHYLNLDENTWEIQKNCGFLYDSSYGFTNDIGYKNKIFGPFFPIGSNFTVFPLPIMDYCFSDHKDKWNKLDEIIQDTIKNDAILVLNWHTDSFNEHDFKYHKKDFIKIIRILQENNAEFNTLKFYYGMQKSHSSD